MLVGRSVILRARIASDVEVLHAGLYDDVVVHSDSDNRPWLPISPTPELSPFRVMEQPPHVAPFTVVTADDDRVVGEAVLWGIDSHHRRAHVGLALLPEERGRGYGLDSVSVLCRYAFSVLGLHRLQIETNATNAAMIATAERTGFTEEGRLKQAGWSNGRFVDEVLLGLLVDDWAALDGSTTA